MKILLVILAALALIAVAITVLDPVDACLDHGGCWDYVDKVCRKDEPKAQALCDRTPTPM